MSDVRRRFLVNLAATLFMTGLIWYTQVVHYPLFALVGPDRFGEYQYWNILYTAIIVIPPMLAELLTSIQLWRDRAGWLTRPEATTGLVLVALLWLTTAVAATLHVLLGMEWSDERLVWVLRTNWIRVLLWSGRSFLLLRVVSRLLPRAQI